MAQGICKQGPFFMWVIFMYHPHRNYYKRKNKNPGILDFLSVELRKRKRNKISRILIYFVSVTCCCGLYVPNMIITKANAKENPGELICLSITKAKKRKQKNPQIFICNHFLADGTFFGVEQTVFLVNRVFVPCQKGAVLMKMATMTNLHSTH